MAPHLGVRRTDAYPRHHRPRGEVATIRPQSVPTLPAVRANRADRPGSPAAGSSRDANRAGEFAILISRRGPESRGPTGESCHTSTQITSVAARSRSTLLSKTSLGPLQKPFIRQSLRRNRPRKSNQADSATGQMKVSETFRPTLVRSPKLWRITPFILYDSCAIRVHANSRRRADEGNSLISRSDRNGEE
jgi:hypothetical protein